MSKIKKILFVITLVTGSSTGLLFAEDQKQQPPNILFIIADDLGARLGCYGEQAVKSPNLDKLAERGVMFSNCFTQFSTCGPSRMSMLTGLYPHESGFTQQKNRIRKSKIKCTSLPRLFRKNGYFTARVGKVFHMGIPGEIGQGGNDESEAWDVVVNNTGWDGKEENYSKAKKRTRRMGYGVAVTYLDPDIKDEEMADGVGTREALRLLDEHNPEKTGKPFMIFMGYYRPHPPMIVPKSHWDAIDKGDIKLPDVPENDRDDIPLRALYKSQPGELGYDEFHFIPESTGKAYSHAYYAAIHFIDNEVGKLLARLKKNGLDKNTIVVFVGDQGFHLGEHGYWHKTSPFDESCHVPMIIVDPRSGPKKENASGLCGLIDLYPTLCSLAGVKPGHKLSGIDLSPQLQKPNSDGKPWELTQMQGRCIGVRTRDYRYSKLTDGVMLYDLKVDPNEWNNISGKPEYKKIETEFEKIIESLDTDQFTAPES